MKRTSSPARSFRSLDADGLRDTRGGDGSLVITSIGLAPSVVLTGFGPAPSVTVTGFGPGPSGGTVSFPGG